MSTSVLRRDERRFLPRWRILIVDDHAFFAACLRAVLDNEPDFLVCGIVPDSAEVIDRLADVKPDLLMVDLSLGPESGLELARRLRAMEVLTPIVLISSLARPGRVQLAGIAHSTFLAKSCRPEELLSAARSLLRRAPAEERAVPADVVLDRTAAAL